MSEHTKKRWQNRRRHDVHDGDGFGTFCGREFKGTRMMILITCTKKTTRGGRHSPTR